MTAEAKPFLQVVHGDPTPEEVAALVTVLTARARAAALSRERARDGGGARRPSRWADRSRLVSGAASEVVRPRGPGAWRASALPR